MYFNGELDIKDNYKAQGIGSIYYQVWDSFDFSDDIIISQCLGLWNNSIFNHDKKVKAQLLDANPLDDYYNITNSVFKNFSTKTKIGKDYKIKGLRIIKNNIIKAIKIDENEIEYK